MIFYPSKKNLYTFLFVSCIFFSYAKETNSLLSRPIFEKANQFYSENQFSKALQQYKILIKEQKIEDPRLYYNYANTLYRLDKIGLAILYYEKALLMSPSDPDILDNLKFVRSTVQNEIEQDQPFFIFEWFKTITLQTSVHFKIYLFLFFWWLFFIVLYLFIFQKKHSQKYSKIISLCFLFFIFFGSLSWYQTQHIHNNNQAIFLKASPTYSGPGDQYKNILKINKGTKVIVLSENKGWSKIKLPNGLISFVLSNKIKNIYLN